MDNYYQNFDPFSEAMCRVPIELLLNECLTVMVSLLLDSSSVLTLTNISAPRKKAGHQEPRRPEIAE